MDAVVAWMRGMDAVVRGMDAVVQRHGCGGAEAWMRW